MGDYLRILVVLACACCLGTSAHALDITLDMNGFPNTSGSRVSGTEIKKPILVPAGEQVFEIKGLKPGGKYVVDMNHNSAEEGSDFRFTVNEEGTGVATIEPVGKYSIVKDFKPGATRLTFGTFPITYNANSGQTGTFHIPGLCKPQPKNPGPLKFQAVPGLYKVDNLVNLGGGAEDFTFIVDDKGNVLPGKDSEEYFEAEGGNINVRNVTVRFQIDPASPVAWFASHELIGETRRRNLLTQVEMQMPVGGGGVNVWSLAGNTIVKSDAIDGFGKPMEGRESKNDFYFMPRLRYDVKTRAYYFDGVNGRSTRVFAEASGVLEEDPTIIGVKVIAKIVSPTEAKPGAP